MPVLVAFWNERKQTNLQFRDETEAFGRFLTSVTGELGILYLDDILAFELQLNALQYRVPHPEQGSGMYSLCPHVRVAVFGHHPVMLFNYLVAENGQAADLPEPGTFYLLLEQKNDAVSMKLITNELGYILTHLEDYPELPGEFSGWVSRKGH